jgi:ribose 1,5-bisphosphokinase
MTPIGPGRLVLVVGPSGAGKDTLIELARAALKADPTIAFPRRVVTRAASAAEAHDTMSDDAFDDAARAGAFALTWHAHGLRYGIPASIDDDIRAGRTVLCNVSRTIVGAARRRYAAVTVALVTAPTEVLAARLAARGRDGDIAQRLARGDAFADLRTDCVIANTGTPADGAAALMAAVARTAGARSSAAAANSSGTAS